MASQSNQSFSQTNNYGVGRTMQNGELTANGSKSVNSSVKRPSSTTEAESTIPAKRVVMHHGVAEIKNGTSIIVNGTPIKMEDSSKIKERRPEVPIGYFQRQIEKSNKSLTAHLTRRVHELYYDLEKVGLKRDSEKSVNREMQKHLDAKTKKLHDIEKQLQVELQKNTELKNSLGQQRQQMQCEKDKYLEYCKKERRDLMASKDELHNLQESHNRLQQRVQEELNATQMIISQRNKLELDLRAVHKGLDRAKSAKKTLLVERDQLKTETDLLKQKNQHLQTEVKELKAKLEQPLPPQAFGRIYNLIQEQGKTMQLTQNILVQDFQQQLSVEEGKRQRLQENLKSQEETHLQEVNSWKQRVDELTTKLERFACTICLDSWQETGDHRAVILPCGHVYGEKCIRECITINQMCPQCRLGVRPDQMRNVFF